MLHNTEGEGMMAWREGRGGGGKGWRRNGWGREGPRGVDYSQEGHNPFVLRLSPLEP